MNASTAAVTPAASHRPGQAWAGLAAAAQYLGALGSPASEAQRAQQLDAVRSLEFIAGHQSEARAALLALDKATQDAGAAAQALRAIAAELSAIAERRPYRDIGDYMHRSWLLAPAEGQLLSARMHTTLRSDSGLWLHDHPWHNLSVVLEGGYWEVLYGAFSRRMSSGAPGAWTSDVDRLISDQGGDQLDAWSHEHLGLLGVFWRGPGAVISRHARTLHRLIVPRGQRAVSLFVTGPRTRTWGFQHTGGVWRDHESALTQAYTITTDYGMAHAASRDEMLVAAQSFAGTRVRLHVLPLNRVIDAFVDSHGVLHDADSGLALDVERLPAS